MGAGVAEVLANRVRYAVLQGDCAGSLRTLPDGCVHCCVTSPPYYGLRDYGTAEWEGGDPACDHRKKQSDLSTSGLDGGKETQGHRSESGRGRCGKCGAVRVDRQIGLEESPEEYVAKMVAVFREVRRVLHPSGSLWLNLGDSFAGSNQTGGTNSISGVGKSQPHCDKPRGIPTGYKAKDLLGIPWVIAFALRADGWYLRQWCPWVKRNPMPESVTDRPGTACETVFLLSKRADYFFDMEAVKRAAVPDDSVRDRDHTKLNNTPGRTRMAGLTHNSYESRNLRSADLWFDSVGMLLADEPDDDPALLGFDVTTKPYKGAHFAVMPKKLIEPCVLAGTSARGVCPACGEPWVRVVEKKREATRPGGDSKVHGPKNKALIEMGQISKKSGLCNYAGWRKDKAVGNRDPERHVTATETLGWQAGCACGAGDPIPAVVLDPFAGSGTVLSVAVDLGRRALGCELNGDYVRLIERRMRNTTPALFCDDT